MQLPFTHHPGRGVPNILQIEYNRITNLQDVPTTYDATQLYSSQGGNLTQFGLFGIDPLCSRPHLLWQRETFFFSSHPSFDDMFSNAVTADGSFFKKAVLDFITITKSLELLV